MSTALESGRYGSGHTVRRIEDPALVTGRGRFTDDVAPAGQVHYTDQKTVFVDGTLPD